MTDQAETPATDQDEWEEWQRHVALFASDTSDRHGGPNDRGSADAYYGRPKNPHKYEGNTGHGEPIKLTDPVEIAAYHAGYDGCDDRKNWS